MDFRSFVVGVVFLRKTKKKENFSLETDLHAGDEKRKKKKKKQRLHTIFTHTVQVLLLLA